jgi:glycolate oxidase iron-sulfur subunit
MDAWMRETHRNAARVMRATGTSVARPGLDASCCGALHVHAGRDIEARRLAQRALAAMPGDAPIVVDSAGCGAWLKEHSDRVVDFSEWVVAQERRPRTRRIDRRIAIQDPCHLRHVQRAHLAVRSLLGETYQLVELGDDGLCCGAGGAYSVTQKQLSNRIRDRKVEAIERASGGVPTVVASANPGCIMQLRGAGVDARHPADLCAEALDE